MLCFVDGDQPELFCSLLGMDNQRSFGGIAPPFVCDVAWSEGDVALPLLIDGASIWSGNFSIALMFSSADRLSIKGLD